MGKRGMVYAVALMAAVVLATPEVGSAAPATVRARPSAGCSAPPIKGALPSDAKVDVAVPGQTGEYANRWYFQHLPSQAALGRPLPLVVDLHGYSEGAQVHLSMSGLSKYGDAEGFITVTPQGQGVVPRWDTALSGSPDIAFIEAMLDQIGAQRCIDLARVYVTGLSNGAFMTSALACVLADRIAAVAPVAGIQAPKACKPARAVPAVAFHGTADEYVAYGGGLGSAALNLPAPDGSGRKLSEGGGLPKEAVTGPTVPETTAAWARRNGCERRATRRRVASDVTRIAYAGCRRGADVQLYRVRGGGHTWPGSTFSQQIASLVGPTTMNVDANEVMWRFFRAHPLAASKR